MMTPDMTSQFQREWEDQDPTTAEINRLQAEIAALRAENARLRAQRKAQQRYGRGVLDLVDAAKGHLRGEDWDSEMREAIGEIRAALTPPDTEGEG